MNSEYNHNKITDQGWRWSRQRRYEVSENGDKKIGSDHFKGGVLYIPKIVFRRTLRGGPGVM